SSSSPLPGCAFGGSPDDDPRPLNVIFHPGARRRRFCSRAKTFLELARIGNAACDASAGWLPRCEILPSYPPQPEDRCRHDAWLSSSPARTAAFFLFVSPDWRDRI